MKPKFKPTPKKVIASTIGRDYEVPTVRQPFFEDASKRPVSFGGLSDILDGKVPTAPVVEPEPILKKGIWEVIKYLVPMYNRNPFTSANQL